MKENEQRLAQAIGKRIRAARKFHELSQLQLANKLGTTQDLISKYERGQRPISIVDLMEIAVVFRVPASYFLGENMAVDTSMEKLFRSLFPPLRDKLIKQIAEYFELQKKIIEQVLNERHYITVEVDLDQGDPILDVLPQNLTIADSEEELSEIYQAINETINRYLHE